MVICIQCILSFSCSNPHFSIPSVLSFSFCLDADGLQRIEAVLRILKCTISKFFNCVYKIELKECILLFFVDRKPKGRSRVDRESDTHQLLLLEEKDVVSSVATVLSDLCGPGEWMPMEKLHAELMEQYSSMWHHSRVRRYLTSEDYPGPDANDKPWFGLLMLLRKYPEHFVINTRSKGRVTLEFVSLVSLLS